MRPGQCLPLPWCKSSMPSPLLIQPEAPRSCAEGRQGTRPGWVQEPGGLWVGGVQSLGEWWLAGRTNSDLSLEALTAP